MVIRPSGAGPVGKSRLFKPGRVLIADGQMDGGLGGASRDFPYPTFPSTTIAYMRTVSDMLGASAGTLADVSTSDSPYGSTAIQLTGNSGTGAATPNNVLSSPINVQNGSIRFSFKPVQNILTSGSALTAFQIELYSAGTPASPGTNYHKAGTSTFINQMSTAGTVSGAGRYQTVSIPTNAFVANGTGADLTAIKWARIGNLRVTTGNILGLGNIDYVPNPRSKAALIFRFDDGYSSAYVDAFPLMEANAVKACGILCPGAPGNTAGGVAFGQAGRLTYAQVAEMCATGRWQIGSQNWSTENVATIEGWTEDQRYAEWAATRNVGRTVGGKYRDTYDGSQNITSAIIRPSKMASFRTIQGFFNMSGVNPPISFGETFPFADRYNMICLNLNSGSATRANDVDWAIDQVIASKGVLILGMHQELGTDAQTLAGFNQALARLVSDAASIEPHTIRSLLASYNGDTLTG